MRMEPPANPLHAGGSNSRSSAEGSPRRASRARWLAAESCTAVNGSQHPPLGVGAAARCGASNSFPRSPRNSTRTCDATLPDLPTRHPREHSASCICTAGLPHAWMPTLSAHSRSTTESTHLAQTVLEATASERRSVRTHGASVVCDRISD